MSLEELADYEDIINNDKMNEDKLNKIIYKKPSDKLKTNKHPHYIIVGHGEVREGQTFVNKHNCNIHYFCRRGNIMLGYLNDREYLIEQMQKMCNKKIIEKENFCYGDEIDNTEYLAQTELETRLLGIYLCDNLDSPIYNFSLKRRYTLEELLDFINNYTKQIYNTNYFLVSILGCRAIQDKPYIIPNHIYGEKLTGTKRKRGQYGGKQKIKSKKRNIKNGKNRRNYTRKYRIKNIRNYKYSKRKYK